MKSFTSKQLREMWIKFYEAKGHKAIKSASVIPENDPSCLFTTAGMHPLVPYLLGEPHPMGKRLTDVQKCIRTGDIDEVGDRYHLTFFEMLGNWSLGDYFKKEKTAWTYEFLTNPNCLGLKPEEVAFTCFEGNENAPKDVETAECLKQLGVKPERIFFLPKSENWWEISRGPCGPDSEMFLDTGKPKCCESCNPSCNCGKFVEIGNDVYMQYNKIGDNEYIPAKQKNVDTGFGLERCLLIFNQVNSVYQTEVFVEAIKTIEKLSGKTYNDEGDEYTKSFRVLADHIRAATVILGDEKGIVPSNIGAGYVLRRLIRRSIMHANKLGIENGHLGDIAEQYAIYFKEVYPEFMKNLEKIKNELKLEEDKFSKTINNGTKEFEKVISGIERFTQFAKDNGKELPAKVISGKAAFRLYDTFGFPLEITKEMAVERGFSVDEDGFKKAYEEHQELARTTSASAFKGGLVDNSYETTRLHTATHLLNAALKVIVNKDSCQKGSNITPERLRFDFPSDHKPTPEEIKAIEDFINDKIQKKIPVIKEIMPIEKAKEQGAEGVFGDKYGEIVSVYTIGNVSKEMCGGPHVNNTSELGTFKIIGTENIGAGIKRIKAVLQ